MSPFVASLFTLCLGFALSALAASAFEAATARRASFRLLRSPDSTAVVAVPLVTVAAPYMMARNLIALRARRRSAIGVAVGTVLAGLWSLALGSVALSGAAALGM
ncbi:hypothetical protein JOD31_003482 [Methylopila capsulata]|uniref:Uncharacterized protein n=1 Tax=Methylopila capsulata TaxID=61654 RepID=A0A9W6IYM0_9HYPH|nr:hypothetical protein [Methylopila capsulata]MBM7853231.1 hypothetical protein [Methylopila capsulata]GLK57555.1 hypothetical protein GCM10008170_35750 [Methylopila capsulata]